MPLPLTHEQAMLAVEAQRDDWLRHIETLRPLPSRYELRMQRLPGPCKRLPPRIAVTTQEPGVRWHASSEPDEMMQRTVQIAEVYDWTWRCSDRDVCRSWMGMDRMMETVAERMLFMPTVEGGTVPDVPNVLGPVHIRRDTARMTSDVTYQFTRVDETVGLTMERLQQAMANMMHPIQQATTAVTELGTTITAATTHYYQNLGSAWITVGNATGSATTQASNVNINYIYPNTTGYQNAAIYHNHWINGSGYADTYDTYIGLDWSVFEETPEQKAASAARAAKLEVARVTADRLWMSILSEAQRKTWELHGHVDVRSQMGRIYRLKPAHSGNVSLLDKFGKPVRKYCAYSNDPGGQFPMGDHLYTQLITLRYNEREFLAKANTWDLLKPNEPFVGQGVDADATVQLAA